LYSEAQQLSTRELMYDRDFIRVLNFNCQCYNSPLVTTPDLPYLPEECLWTETAKKMDSRYRYL